MSFKKICGFTILIPLAVALIAFIIANRGLVAVNFNIFAALFGKNADGYSFTAPLFLWLFVFLLLGILAGGLAMLPKLCRERREINRLTAENSRLQKAAAAAAKPKSADKSAFDRIHL